MAKKTTRRRTKKSTKATSEVRAVSPNKSLKKNLTMEDLKYVRELLAYRQSSEIDTEFVAPQGTVEIKDLSNQQALDRIQQIVSELLHQIDLSGNPAFDIPSRTQKNIIYDEKQDLLLLGNNTSKRHFLPLHLHMILPV